jgi:hypothetical protein
VLERIGGRFACSEPRVRAGVYLRGLLSAAERKNGWTLAEQGGDRSPDAMQRVLNHAEWDADAVSPHLSTKTYCRIGDWAAVNNVEAASVPFYASWLDRIEQQFTALRYFALGGTHTNATASRPA